MAKVYRRKKTYKKKVVKRRPIVKRRVRRLWKTATKAA